MSRILKLLGLYGIYNRLKRKLPQKYNRLFFRDKYLNKLIKNAGTLLSGNIVGDIFGLFSFIIVARALSVDDFGLFTLAVTYVLIIDGLVNFQTWQALIKFGGEELLNRNSSRFKRLMKSGLLIDFATACFGTGLAFSLVSIVSAILDWESIVSNLSYIACVMILFRLRGFPTAALRLFDNFKTLAQIKMATSFFKFIGVVIVFFTSQNVFVFLIVWVITDVLENIILLYFGFKEMNKQGYSGFLKETVSFVTVRKEFKGLANFIITTNLHSSVKLSVKQFDIMLVGWLLSPAGAGVFKIAKQFSGTLLKLSDPFYQAIYPDLNKMWVKKELSAFKKIIIQSSLVALIGGLIAWIGFILWGDSILSITVGDEYNSAYSVIVIYMLGIILAVGGFPLQPAMLSMGKQNVSFAVQNIAVIIYIGSMFPLVVVFNLEGAAVAFVLYYLSWTAIMVYLQHSYMKKKSYDE